MYPTGPKTLLLNPPPNLDRLPRHAPNPLPRSLRPLLGAHHAHIHAVPLLLPRLLHLVLPLLPRHDVRVRLRPAQHQRHAGLRIRARAAHPHLARAAVRGRGRVERGGSRGGVGVRDVRLDTRFGADFLPYWYRHFR